MTKAQKPVPLEELWILAKDHLVDPDTHRQRSLQLEVNVGDGSVRERVPEEQSLEEWARRPYWWPDEAMALLLGKTPPLHLWLHGSRYSLENEYFERRCRQVHRLISEQFGHETEVRATPTAYIEWLTSWNLTFPPDLVELVRANGSNLQNYKALYEGATARLAGMECELNKMRKQLEQAKKELQHEKERSEKPLNPKEKTTLQKLVIGMAVKSYKYDTRKAHPRVIKPIKGDLDSLELGLEEDTISKHLRAAAELLQGKEHLVCYVLGQEETGTHKK